MYSVRGRNAKTAANNDDAVFGFWNPHASQIIRVIAVSFSLHTAAGVGSNTAWYGSTWRRTTARGTPGSTVTPDISNDSRNGVGPVSGALLDLAAFTVQPTLEADDWGPLIGYMGALAAVGMYTFTRFPGSGVYIPPGTGIALIQKETIVSPILEISVTWAEDF